MGKKVSRFRDHEGNIGYHFHCPACNCTHMVYVKGNGVPTWDFNGSMEHPTFSPSLKTYWPGQEDEYTCHSYIRDGYFEYLKDCTHEHAGEKVEIPDWDGEE